MKGREFPKVGVGVETRSTPEPHWMAGRGRGREVKEEEAL